VDEIMSTLLITTEPEENVANAAQTMLEKKMKSYLIPKMVNLWAL